MIDLKIFPNLFRRLSAARRASICAHLIGPGIVLALAIGNGYGRDALFDLTGPVTISELRSELTEQGKAVVRHGVAITVEPDTTDLRIPLGASTTSLWTSLDKDTAEANHDRIYVAGGGVVSRTPLLGVTSPITMVLEGEVGKDIQLPGATASIDDWRLTSKRSLSILSGVMFSCIFAFGMALSAAIPMGRPDQHAGRKERTEPHEDQIISRHAVDSPARIGGIGPHTKPNRKKVPRVPEHRNK